MGTDIVSWVIIICCIMMSAYFSATETAFSSLNRIRMKNMAEKGSKRGEEYDDETNNQWYDRDRITGS